jgi:hypothetical protein
MHMITTTLNRWRGSTITSSAIASRNIIIVCEERDIGRESVTVCFHD